VLVQVYNARSFDGSLMLNAQDGSKV